VAKAALLTGGTSGIGLAIAKMLKEDGYDLTIASRRKEKVDAAAEELGGDVLAVAVDVRKEEELERLVGAHRERWSRLDVLVNSAGVGAGGGLEDLQTKHWDLQFDVNVRAIFLMSRLCLPLLRDSKGWVINLASIAGTLATPWLAAYGASKAAVISLTKSFNAEFEKDGVRAIAICPALVDTPMTEWSDVPDEEMIRPADIAEVTRMALHLSPFARVSQVVVERMGEHDRLPV